MMIQRKNYLDLIDLNLQVHPICAILGARQVGKTTLAHEFAQQQSLKVEFFDLENPENLQSLETPMLTLSKYPDRLIIIDEIQRRPELFPILRVLVDDRTHNYKFLILGSASQDLIRQSSETLAGRIGYIELPSLALIDFIDGKTSAEQAKKYTDELFIKGGFPRSFLAKNDEQSFLWRKNYISTFLERDLPSFGFDILPQTMHRFWMMLCFYHGQTFNAHEISYSLMISDKTARKYLDILAGTFMIRILQPWHENIKKRQVKTPKIYFRDSGIYNCLSSIHSLFDILKTPKMGLMWEGFALEQVICSLQVNPFDCYFWNTQNDAELDLLIFKNGKRIGFEFKYADAPKITKSMHSALQDLKLDHLYIIYPGTKTFPMTENITVCNLANVVNIKI